MDYKTIVESFSLQKGDRIWLSSEIIKLAIKFKQQWQCNKLFDGSALLDAFQDAVGSQGTILIPTFSFEFSNKGQYNIKTTKGTTGALGNIALTREDFRRTKHPMHSFAVWGCDQEELVSMRNKHSFGIDSPFGYCLGKHVKQIMLGTDYVHAMTFVHYAETVCNVPYRFAKSFTGEYTDENGQTETRIYDYAARRLEIKPAERFNKIGAILEDKGIARKVNCADIESIDESIESTESIESYVVDLAKCFPVICDDIVNNMCGNIYDFNIDRAVVFGGKALEIL